MRLVARPIGLTLRDSRDSLCLCASKKRMPVDPPQLHVYNLEIKTNVTLSGRPGQRQGEARRQKWRERPAGPALCAVCCCVCGGRGTNAGQEGAVLWCVGAGAGVLAGVHTLLVRAHLPRIHQVRCKRLHCAAGAVGCVGWAKYVRPLPSPTSPTLARAVDAHSARGYRGGGSWLCLGTRAPHALRVVLRRLGVPIPPSPPIDMGGRQWAFGSAVGCGV